MATNPFTKRLVENFSSLEDDIWKQNTDTEVYNFTGRLWYIQSIKRRYMQILDSAEDEIEEEDMVISDYVRDIVTISERNCTSCDGFMLLAILNYYVYSFILTEKKNYSNLHTLFLTPLLNDPLFKRNIQDPLSMRFVFTCLLYCNEPLESNPKLDKKLNTFYLDLKNLGHDLYWEFLKMIARRTFVYKEELIATVWHPRRVERLLEMGGFELLEAL